MAVMQTRSSWFALGVAAAAAASMVFGVSAASARKLYWVDLANSIHRANLDGSGEQDLGLAASAGAGTPVALDPRAGKLYWVHLANTIHRANLDGSGEQDLGLAASANSGTPVTLDLTPALPVPILSRTALLILAALLAVSMLMLLRRSFAPSR